MFGTTFPKGVWATPEGTQMEGQTEDTDSLAAYRAYQEAEEEESYNAEAKQVDMENVNEAVELASTNPREVAQKRLLALKGEL